MPGDGLIANPVEKNVAFVVYNLLQTELVHCRATGVPPRFDILSAWVSDVMFPSSAFGFDSNIISAFMDSQSKKGTTVEIVRLLQRFGGRSRVVALDYFSTARNWKNPEVEDMHPTGRIELCDWDLRELGVLIEFAKSGTNIFKLCIRESRLHPYARYAGALEVVARRHRDVETLATEQRPVGDGLAAARDDALAHAQLRGRNAELRRGHREQRLLRLCRSAADERAALRDRRATAGVARVRGRRLRDRGPRVGSAVGVWSGRVGRQRGSRSAQ